MNYIGMEGQEKSEKGIKCITQRRETMRKRGSQRVSLVDERDRDKTDS